MLKLMILLELNWLRICRPNSKLFTIFPPEELNFEQRALLPSILDGLVPNLQQIAKLAADDSTRLASVNLIDEIRDINERIIKQRVIEHRLITPIGKLWLSPNRKNERLRREG